MKYNKHVASLLVVCLFSAMFYASKTTQRAATVSVPIKTPNYDYVPAESKGRNNITLALVKPIFAPTMKYGQLKMFRDYSEHMAMDFEEIVTKRGYTLRGPFAGASDMVYDDKRICSLYLQPEILIDMDMANVKYLAHSSTEVIGGRLQTVTSYSFTGTITLTGRINMMFMEPFTQEKIKILSISQPQKTISILSQRRYLDYDFYNVLVNHKDAGVINPIISALEECYQTSLTTAYNHLDPQEIAMYVDDAKSARGGRK